MRASEGRPRTPPAPPAPSITPEQQKLVELYLSTVDEDRVDCDLVVHLLLHIHTTQGPGAVLVFLPGYEDIAGVRDLVGREQGLSDVNLLVLHSQVCLIIHMTKNYLSFRWQAKITEKLFCLQDIARSSSPPTSRKHPSQCRMWSLSWTVGR